MRSIVKKIRRLFRELTGEILRVLRELTAVQDKFRILHREWDEFQALKGKILFDFQELKEKLLSDCERQFKDIYIELAEGITTDIQYGFQEFAYNKIQELCDNLKEILSEHFGQSQQYTRQIDSDGLADMQGHVLRKLEDLFSALPSVRHFSRQSLYKEMEERVQGVVRELQAENCEQDEKQVVP